MKLFIYIAKHNETIHWSREFQISEGDSSARNHGTALFIDGMWTGRYSENKHADVYIWNIAWMCSIRVAAYFDLKQDFCLIYCIIIWYEISFEEGCAIIDSSEKIRRRLNNSFLLKTLCDKVIPFLNNFVRKSRVWFRQWYPFFYNWLLP